MTPTTFTYTDESIGTLTLDGSGGKYRLMLVDGTTFAPLCKAWENERK